MHMDVTAVHKDQLSWAKEIGHHPTELLSFYPPTAKNVSKKAIGNLKYDGKLLLDVNGNAVRDFPSLPLVISSMVEGFRVEAWMRSDSRMVAWDIISRMPAERVTDSAGHQELKPVYDSKTVQERARRFRISAGLISWRGQGEDRKIKEFMNELRSPTEIANNQTIGRYLTNLEQASLAKLNVGTRLNRTGKRQDPEASQKYLDRMHKRMDLTFDFDCRAERPETQEEIQEIQNALQQTYRDFAFYTSTPLEVPNNRDTYFDQWNALQVQLNRIWANDKTKNIEPPQLFALGKWSVSFDNWVSAPPAYLTYLRK